ncbi:hypothetical protein CLRAG_03940 [Clostridium ragsdalei P11]|uniref:DoxX n=1 Tax=Clostridium ragsdalei P11 TaxID=1353534 RepID=A0A1A6B2G6_9CLOT|nr:DUF6790 family protein [Clostridium ragsdalei]OBR96524.1 hypothetical protein CLRAG_03940 [Clostridium ragsdalei P11]
MKRKFGFFKIVVILFFYVLPLISIIIDVFIFKNTMIVQVVLKWCIFFGVGLRLFTAGLKQSLNPAFTAKGIFNITDEKVFPIVRELGFANICFGLIGITSLLVSNFRYTAASLGILFYFLAFMQHMIRKNKNSTEVFVTITNLSIVLELLIPMFIILV